jgi:hypothetical protein
VRGACIERDDFACIRQQTQRRLATQAKCVVEEDVVAAAASVSARVPRVSLIVFLLLCVYVFT